MVREKKTNVYVGDFETTVYEGQKRTDVWASALTRVFDPKDRVQVFSSLPETYEWLVLNKHEDIILYYHNLKFDGSFWLAYLNERGDYTEAYVDKPGLKIYEGTQFERELKQGEFLPNDKMPLRSYKYLISDMGAWYSVTIKTEAGHIIELRDSLKLIPCSVRRMGKDFKTKHQKTEIEYTGFREPGGFITPIEREYIANDVLVVKEVIEIMFNEGHKKLTIGACCLNEYKKMIGDQPKGFSHFDQLFPKLEVIRLREEIFGDENADAYIRRSYRGGWSYVMKRIKGMLLGRGCTADVNSLYPSVMSGESGNRYPVGVPHFFHSEQAFNEVLADETKYYFIRVKTRFKIKKDHLPFIQIKRNKLYKSTEMLETSDVYDRKTGEYLDRVIDYKTGEVKTTSVILTLTKTDWELAHDHYDFYETEILDGCWFNTAIGIFDEYINKYRKIKENSSGAIRSIAKLFLILYIIKQPLWENGKFEKLKFQAFAF